MSDVNLHVNMTPLTVEDRLLIKTAQTEKDWIAKMIVEFPARRRKWQLLFDLKGLMIASNVVWSKLIQISSRLIT